MKHLIARVSSYILILSLLTIGTSFEVLASSVFEVRLTWTSQAQAIDLDLYVKNTSGQIVNYVNTTSTWGATHTRDDQGSAYSNSYETFSIDLSKMDCAGGRYTFYVSHYSGPVANSTITASQNGTNYGTWYFDTTSGDNKEAVYYDAQPQNCPSNQTLSTPTLSTLTDGNDVLALLVFPANLNSGTNFVTQITVPSNYAVKKVELLQTSAELYNAQLKMISNSARTQTVMLFSTTAIGFIPVIGDVASFVISGSQMAIDSAEALGKANDLYVKETSRNLFLLNPRNVKFLLWYSKTSGGSVQPTITTTATF